MKHSIRTRFAIIFMGLMAAVLVGIWCINNWLLEDFYIRDKISVLETAYREMDALVLECIENGSSLSDEFEASASGYAQTEAALLLRKLNDQYNIKIVIVDSIRDRLIGTSAWDVSRMKEKVRRYILGDQLPGTETMVRAENYTIQKTYDARTQSFFLESWGYYSDNSTVFIMSTPLASIRESVMLSNRFLAYVGLAALLLSCVILFVTTRKVTKPILQLAHLSERMSLLDFDARYIGEAEDEIGILGNSMNALSSKLKETIGALKTANNELQNDIEEKIQIDEMRKDFIANVSHELKTPIALIQGYAEGLTAGLAEDPDSRDYYCNVIMDEASKMNQMVHQLLNLTALEFGNDAIVMERFDLTELIRGVLDSAAILIQQKEATVEFDQTDPVCVWADEFKIEEVVTNYVSNALNHIDGERRITIRIQQQEKEVTVLVKNTGQPIPETDLERIWQKFYKVDKARTRAYGGSGIGLSIVKAIMDSHHKKCGVYNEADGVVFWFTLDTQN